MEGRAWAITGIPQGEAAKAQQRGAIKAEKLRREGKEKKSMPHRVRGQEVVVVVGSREVRDEIVAEMRGRGLVVTVKRWNGRK